MKKLWGITIAAAVILPLAGFSQSASYYDRSFTRMSFVQGDVFVQRAQDLGFEKGEVNLVVVAGDKIGTKDGRLEVQLGRGNHLRLDRYTQIDLANLPDRDLLPTKLHVLAGSVFLRVNSLDREKNIEIHTPDASYYILAEGLYRVDVRDNRETEFSVYEGAAEAAGEGDSRTVNDRQRISASDGRFVSAPFSLLDRRDEFGNWNDTRDGLYARKLDRSYLPAEYSDYENELNQNGDWVDEGSYGSVWVPRSTYSDWQPYTYGRWAWYPIIGWTWVSSEPWGWCTSHYGRWGWRLNLGWYWIPQNHWGWGPAWVNWWHDDYYVGWCPLSYYNYPAVIINNNFYDRHQDRNFRDYSRTMVMINRNQLQDRRIDRIALGRDRILSRAGQINLQGAQPSIRPAFGREDRMSGQAAQALSRNNIRTIDRGFASNGRRLSSEDTRSSAGSRPADVSSGSGARVGRQGDSGSRAGTLSGRTQEITPRGRQDSSAGGRVNGEAGNIRSYPSENVRNSSSGGSATVRRTDPGSENRSTGAGVIRRYDSRSDGSGVSAGRAAGGSNSSTARTISPGLGSSRNREYSSGSGSSVSSRSTSPSTSGRSVERSSSSSAIRSFPSRESGSSRSSGTSSRSSDNRISSRSYSAPSGSSSRSYSSPSRSSSSSSRSYSAPSRSSSSSSRSYSAPSGSSSRSYSSPSRSSSSSSRSYSAPSRSSSSSSRSSSSSSSRSSSGSSVSRSSSSSGRSSSGSARRR